MPEPVFASPSARPMPRAITSFLALSFAISWTVWIAGWLMAGQQATLRSAPMLIAIYAGSFGPGLAAAWLSWRSGTLRQWLADLTRVRIGWRGLAALALPLPLAALGLTVLLDYRPLPQPGVEPLLAYLTLFPAAVLNGAVTALVGAGPLGEEGGWRGFLLPRLLERTGELRASLVLGVIWSAWHLPIMALLPDWRNGLPLGFYLPVYTFLVIGLSVLMTRVWLLARRSTLAAIWMHGVINAIGGIAFSSGVWASNWADTTTMLHFTASVWLAALVLVALRRRAKA